MFAFPARLMGRRKGPADSGTISLVASAFNVDGATLKIPAAAQAGDLGVLVDGAYKFIGTTTQVIPAGWSSLQELSQVGSCRANTLYKIIQPGDPGTNITGMTSSYEGKTMAIFRLSGGPISSVTVGVNNGQATSGDPAAQNVPPVEGAAPYIVIGSVYGADSSSFWLNSPSADVEIGTSPKLAWWLMNEEGSQYNVKVDANDRGQCTMLVSVALELRV